MNRWWTASLALGVAVTAACGPKAGLIDPGGKHTPIFQGVPRPELAPWDKAPPPRPTDKQIFLVYADEGERWNAVLCDCNDAKVPFAVTIDQGELATFLRPLDKVVLVDVPRRPPPPPPDGDDAFRAMAEAACAANPRILIELSKVRQNLGK